MHTELPEILLLSNDVFNDRRGYLSETFKSSEFLLNGLPDHFKQDLTSSSHKGVVRGLHYQLSPKAQGKLVGVLKGSIFDVVVDLRQDNPTFGTWKSFYIESGNSQSIWIPPGFAHEFQALEDDTIVSYKMTDEYSAETQRGIIWNDPELGIDWPVSEANLSDRDLNFPRFSEASYFLG